MIITLSKRMLALPRRTIVRAKRISVAKVTLRKPVKSFLGSFEQMLTAQVSLLVRYED